MTFILSAFNLSTAAGVKRVTLGNESTYKFAMSKSVIDLNVLPVLI
jgi:hypothetical protein